MAARTRKRTRTRDAAVIKREYERANRALNIMVRRKDKSPWFQELWGARQALAWVLNEPAMAPVLACVPHLSKRLDAKTETQAGEKVRGRCDEA